MVHVTLSSTGLVGATPRPPAERAGGPGDLNHVPLSGSDHALVVVRGVWYDPSYGGEAYSSLSDWDRRARQFKDCGQHYRLPGQQWQFSGWKDPVHDDVQEHR